MTSNSCITCRTDLTATKVAIAARRCRAQSDARGRRLGDVLAAGELLTHMLDHFSDRWLPLPEARRVRKRPGLSMGGAIAGSTTGFSVG
jgi:hypothetical protein